MPFIQALFFYEVHRGDVSGLLKVISLLDVRPAMHDANDLLIDLLDDLNDHIIDPLRDDDDEDEDIGSDDDDDLLWPAAVRGLDLPPPPVDRARLGGDAPFPGLMVGLTR